MEFRTQQFRDVLIVAMEGELDAFWANEARETLWQHLERGNHRLVLDLTGLTYLSSGGLRVLLQLYQRVASLKGQLALAEAQPFVREVLTASGFGSTLKLYDTLNEALDAVQPSGARTGDGWAAAQDRVTAAGRFLFRSGEPGAGRLRLLGEADDLLYSRATAEKIATVNLGQGAYTLGVGALGARATTTETLDRLGELLAVPSAAYWLPGDSRQVPDFLQATDGQAQLPIHMLFGLSMDGPCRAYGRFTAPDPIAGTDLGEVGKQLLAWAGTQTDYAGLAGVVLRADLDELWGVGLRQSPRAGHAPANGKPISHRENIKDWLNFPTEPAYANHTLLAVGVLADPKLGGLNPEQLRTAFGTRETDTDRDLLLHMHGAVFRTVPELGGENSLDQEIQHLVREGELVHVTHLLPGTRIRKASFALWMLGDVATASRN